MKCGQYPHLNLPEQRVTKTMMKNWPHLADIDVLEVNSHDATMLLGANVLDAIAQYEFQWGASGQPATVLTKFGWTLIRSLKSFVPPDHLHVQYVMHVHRAPCPEDLLHQQVQNWWHTDAFGCKYQQDSPRSLIT